VPVPVGQPVAAASGTAVVCFETNVVEPFAFVAVTETRSVRPASAWVSVYVLPDAPLIVAQLLPSASQRLHENATLVGFPLHVPWLAVSVDPTVVVPEMAGSVVGVGAFVLETTGEAAEFALPEPVAFFAVTVTVSVCPTSAATALYVAAVAPAIALHEAPLASHRFHAYVYDVGVSVQVPLVVERVCPSWAVPEMVGLALLVGLLPAA
jgi:hypothetical protein